MTDNQVSLEKAVHFVLESGDGVMASLASFAAGSKTTAETLKVITRYQRADGGWTKTDKDFQADLSVISTTWVALQWLFWIGAGDSSECQRTAAYLGSVQHEAGFWDEPLAIRQYDPRPWMQPGVYANQLWLTSAVCCKLKELGLESMVKFEQALDFLRKGWDGHRYPVYNHTNWMVLGLLGLVGPKTSSDGQIMLGCRRFLLDAIEQDRVDPGDYSAIVYASKLAGEPAHDLHELSLGKMLTFQRPDGGWKSNYGEVHRPSLTVDALFILNRLG